MLLELLGQDVESRLGTDTYDVDKKKVKRGAGERFFDWALGQEEDIQEAGKTKREKNLEKQITAAGVNPERITFDADTKGGRLAELVRDQKDKDQLVAGILATGAYKGDRAALQAMDLPGLSSQLQSSKIEAQRILDANNPATQRQIDATKKAEGRADRAETESNRRFDLQERRYLEDRISNRETKLLELDVLKQKQANEMAMFDKKLAADQRTNKRERMAAIIAGLANMGGAFAI